MEDVKLVENFEGVEEVGDEFNGLLFGDGALLADFGLEGTPVAVLVHEVMIILGLDELVEADDLLAGPHLGEHGDFVHEALLGLGVVEDGVVGDDLDGAVAGDGGVRGLEDLAVVALADALLQEIVFDFLAHL